MVQGGWSDAKRDREWLQRDRWGNDGGLRHGRVGEFWGNIGKVGMNDWGWGAGFCGDWRYGARVIVVMGDRVVGRVKEVFGIIGIRVNLGAGI